MDSFAVAAGISQAAKAEGVEVGIRLEFDTGFGRCGLGTSAASIAIAKEIMALPNLRWEGISVYPGHIMGDHSIREQDIARENERLDGLFAKLDAAHVPYPVVSGGNTPAAFESHRFHGVTEVRPGTYVFNDRNTVEAESAVYSDCAATVLATVVSTSVPGTAIIDAGSKTLSADALLSGRREHFGYVQDHPELILHDLSEEHGHLTVADGGRIKIGDRVRVIPNHVCPCINLHDRVFVVCGEQVVDQWNVAARGKVA
jgi:D-serine deaminase-like pyridoxal phosphate-dependent protein